MTAATLVAAAAAGLAAGVPVHRAVARVRSENPADHAPPRNVRLVVMLSTAALFVVLTARLTALDLLPALPAYLWFAAVGTALTVIDIDCKRLPNFLVLPSYPAVFALLAVAAAVQDDWPALLRAAVGAAALFGFYLVLALIYPAGMGFGDVKLAGVVGAVLAYLSYGVLLIGAMLAFVLAAVAGIALLVTRRGRIGTTIPFGPYMIAAAIVAIVAAEPLARAYLSSTGM